ncbi:hypothetical protein [Sorangium sp. So ce1151]|uniref:hypothetical protein n=1 Tax=Sorangium sp. So ce1151 TaxID=3133332 RepID=UPI003F6169E4
MLLPDLEQRLRWWQARLGLRDWSLAIRYVDDLNLDGQPVWGLCRRLVDNRTAEILIRTPADAAELAEVEETIVHELLHCLLAPLGGCEPASVAAEEQAVWALSPLLVQLGQGAPRAPTGAAAQQAAKRLTPLLVELGQSARGRILARAMSRAGVLLAAGRTRSSGRTRMDPRLIAMIKALLASESIQPDQVKALLAEVLAAAEGAGGSADDTGAAAEVDDDVTAGQRAAAEGDGEAEGGAKPYQRAAAAAAAGGASSVAVQALVAAARARVEAPRRTKEERTRELRLPRDIAAIAVLLPDDEFEDFVRQVEPLARASGPARRSTQGEGAGGAGAPQGMSREAARARLPLDQRQALTRTFGSRAARPTVARTAGGELVMSHVGNVPEGSTPMGGNGGK